MSHKYAKTYECPACGYDIEIPKDCLSDKKDSCRGGSCDKEFGIDWDADNEDGIWTDKTKLYPLTMP